LKESKSVEGNNSTILKMNYLNERISSAQKMYESCLKFLEGNLIRNYCQVNRKDMGRSQDFIQLKENTMV